MDDGIESARVEPALGLLVGGSPRREIVGEHAPRGTSAHEPAQAVESLVQVVVALGGIEGDEDEIRVTSRNGENRTLRS